MAPKNAPVPPPESLGKAGKRFWKSTLETYAMTDAHHLRLLENAGLCLDRATAAQAVIALEGITCHNSRGEVREHPAVNTERQSFQVFRQTVRELGLDVEPPEARGHRRGEPELESCRPSNEGHVVNAVNGTVATCGNYVPITITSAMPGAAASTTTTH